MTPIVPTIAEESPSRAARRRTVPVRTRPAMPTPMPAALPPVAALNRRTLRSELMALYDQYEADVRCASRIEAENPHLANEAADARRDARRRMSLVADLLDSEFPGWEANVCSTRRMPATSGTASCAVSSHT